MNVDPTRFVFGGVAFDVHPAPDLAWRLGTDHRTFKTSFDASPVAAHIDCVVALAPELSAEQGYREISWDWDEEVGRVVTRGVRADVRRLGANRYAATAVVAPDQYACSHLCTAVVGAIASNTGGLILHASGIHVGDGVVLFVGPSGAGKTTSANQCLGARWFARDRAVVFPTQAGWHTAPMSGGDVIDLPPSARRILPLRGILRVRRSSESARISDLDALPALSVLRESLQTAPLEPDDEQRALDAALGLHSDVPIGELHNVLGAGILPLIEHWIGQ